MVHSLSIAAGGGGAAPGSGSGGGGHLWIFFVFVAVVGVGMIFARILWRASAWQYRNPQAVQPSETMFSVERIFGVVLIAVGMVGAIVAGGTGH
jgi:hypothetical protein